MPPSFVGNVGRWISDDVLETLTTAVEEENAAIEAKFKEKVALEKFKGSVELIVEEGSPIELLSRAGRYYDLLLIGQFLYSTDEDQRLRADELVLRSGRPIIIVPNGYKVRPFSEHAVIAWNGSRPAARALSDAMQILETKSRLDVVTVTSEGDEADSKDVSPSNDILRHLNRHGIEAKIVKLSAPRGSHGPAITEYCSKVNPDVLVMGGYGHARLREELFGGATQHVLRHMNVPVFMSH
jgi:nucleotide-binding universal stress UspA family protein